VSTRSPHIERTVAGLSASGFTVTTRKIVSRVSGTTTACGLTVALRAAVRVPEKLA